MEMKNITVTYDVLTFNNEEKEYGEAAFTMLISAELAERLADGKKCGVAYNVIERILENVEELRYRHFVSGSIKDIR